MYIKANDWKVMVKKLTELVHIFPSQWCKIILIYID